MALICNYLMIREVRHLFMYLLAICISSLENVYSVLPIFFDRVVFLDVKLYELFLYVVF